MAMADPSDLYWMQQPGVPEHRTHEQRILAMQVDSYKVLCDIREHLMCIEHELRKPPVDMEEIRDAIRELATQTAIAAKAPVDMDDFVYSPRKPAAALKPGKRK